MILKTVVINGYKSFRKKVELPIPSRTAVLIGPNDHGKTNALLAVEKLNPDIPFTPTEVNDRLPSPESAYISFVLALTAQEIRVLTVSWLSVKWRSDVLR